MSEEKQEQVQEEVETQEEGQQQEEEKPLTAEDVQKMIQSETDRVRTEYSKKLKDLEKEKQELEKEKMSEEERKQHEFEQYQKELQEKEQSIKEKELNLHTTDLLKEHELPLDFRPFLVGQDEKSTKKNVEEFKKLWIDTLNDEVDKRFKASGRKVDTKEDTEKKDPIQEAFNQTFKKKK